MQRRSLDVELTEDVLRKREKKVIEIVVLLWLNERINYKIQELPVDFSKPARRIREEQAVQTGFRFLHYSIEWKSPSQRGRFSPF